VDIILNASCNQVGLRLDSHDLEYPFWWLLDAPESGIQLESVETFSELERYLNRDFNPCALICTICGDRQTYSNLVRVWSGEEISVFLAQDR